MKTALKMEIGVTSSTTPSGVIRQIMNQMVGYVNHVIGIKTSIMFSDEVEAGELSITEDIVFNKLVEAKIILNPGLQGRSLDQLIVVAHEIGHIEDIVSNYGMSLQEFLVDYRPGTDDITTKIATEHRAWGYAIRLLHCYGFKEWERFMDIVDSSFTSYFKEGHSDYTYEECRALLVNEIEKTK
jgi:hypothetical protein